MRVVGGRLRGRNIASPSSNDIRPTQDRLRESLFNILMHGATGLVDAALFGDDSVGLVNGLYGLAVLLPGLAVAVRRLEELIVDAWTMCVPKSVAGCMTCCES